MATQVNSFELLFFFLEKKVDWPPCLIEAIISLDPDKGKTR